MLQRQNEKKSGLYNLLDWMRRMPWNGAKPEEQPASIETLFSIIGWIWIISILPSLPKFAPHSSREYFAVCTGSAVTNWCVASSHVTTHDQNVICFVPRNHGIQARIIAHAFHIKKSLLTTGQFAPNIRTSHRMGQYRIVVVTLYESLLTRLENKKMNINFINLRAHACD